MKDTIKLGDVVKVINSKMDLGNDCFIVETIHPWGITGVTSVPNQGIAYARFDFADLELVEA